MNTRRTLYLKRLLLAFPVAVGMVALATAAPGTSPGTKTAVDHGASTPSPSRPSPVPDVTVNGKRVQTDSGGNADVPLGAGRAHINTSNGTANVTTSGNSDNLNVSVQTQTSGGISHSSTHVYSSTSTSNGKSQGVTHTHVFSTDSAHVEINSP